MVKYLPAGYLFDVDLLHCAHTNWRKRKVLEGYGQIALDKM